LLCFQQSLGLGAELKHTPETIEIEQSGHLSLRALKNISQEETPINLLTATALLRTRIKRDHNFVQVQLRPLLTHSAHRAARKTSAVADELYWEHRLSPVSFVFLGKRKIVNGVAIGRNPSDFLNQVKPQDRTLRDEDRRAETEGDSMAGWSYFGQSYSIQSLLSVPARNSHRIRAMLQINYALSTISTDVSLVAYYADRPALGVNTSSTLGENVTFYTEAALRKGRDRQTPLLSANGAVMDAVNDTSRWIADFVMGAQYTTGNGMTSAAEYWRNDHGFSNREYAGITKSLTSGQGNPRLAGNLLGTPGLQKNSILTRISNIPLFSASEGEITWIRNMDDSSHLLRAAVHWDMSDTDNLWIGVDKFSGAPLSEYGTSKIDWRFFLNYKKYF